MRPSAWAAAGALALAVAAWRATAKTPLAPLSAEAAAKLRILDDILSSKNDNDPRLERDFESLSAETKRLLRLKYRSTAPERRNERGTIVYLLGRNLNSPEDWGFLREVAGEPPCLSLSDCSRTPSSAAAGAADEVTLAYPSLVPLRQARGALQSAPSGPFANEALAVLKAGRGSKSPAVARMATRAAP